MRHLLRVMTCAARHEFGRESELFCRLINHTSDANVGRRWRRQIGLLEFKFRPGRFFDLPDFILNLLKQRLNLRRVKIADAKS